MQPDQWLPLTEYALRSGMSISTLRRKIKSNTIDFRMEDGRYLIRSDADDATPLHGFSSSDAPAPRPVAATRLPEAPAKIPTAAPLQREVASSVKQVAPTPAVPALPAANFSTEFSMITNELHQSREENSLRWRALEARVAGLAKRLEMFSEQIAEVKMLVKIFEEKLDERI